MTRDLHTRLEAGGPKRILSLDGGGIRGSITVGFLEQIEIIVRERLGPQATLADYFDLIGGTSTGAIIATMLALGQTVEQVKDKYLKLGPKVFSKRTLWARLPFIGARLFTAWSVKPLEEQAKALFSEKTTLGSPSIRTGLCIVTKRADTFSTWPYINHPDGQYYLDNAEIPLWKLIRATSAAPTYFRPIRLDVGEPGKPDYGVFIDGGVSMANNPALQLFLVATLDGFRFRWKTGEDDLLIVSVGTGRWDQTLLEGQVLKSENVFWARNVPDLLMQDASEQNELILQYLSRSPTARKIDSEVGTLERDLLGAQAHLRYIRYNAVLDTATLKGIGVDVDERALVSLRDMSVGSNSQRLYEIGAAFAAQQVDRSHFPTAFNPIARATAPPIQPPLP
jgi:uncharacterized protein